ncbi:hypothetical protein LTR28_003779 [Elasticomyces elasticus]|nr:hypothetical protein LTR28_003779 [Elasticomyces elasticus]
MHQASFAPKESADDTTAREYFEERTSSISWHSNVTFKEQPPGITFLYLLEGFQKRLHGLDAVHGGHEQAANSLARNGIVRRAPVADVHPIVRTHLATGEKALYVNPQFTRRIVGFKKKDSDYLLNFLYDHTALGADFKARVKWEKGTVIVWENRVTSSRRMLPFLTGRMGSAGSWRGSQPKLREQWRQHLKGEWHSQKMPQWAQCVLPSEWDFRHHVSGSFFWTS